MRNKISFVALIALGFISCTHNNNFNISGSVSGASEASTIYLEHLGLQKISTLDSVKLDKTGAFSFTQAAPLYPDLYRLRMNGKNFIFAIDSTEHVKISANASGNEFSFPHTIENSQKTQDISELRKSVITLQTAYNAFENKEITAEEIAQEVENHKTLARKLILENPSSIAAYFALYQKISGLSILTPYDKQDRPYFSAVATAFQNSMPDYERTKNVYTLTMSSIIQEREQRNAAYMQKLVEEGEAGLIDIELPNQFGNMRKLSDTKGKVVLLDFSSYAVEEQREYVFALRELYEKYAERGFEIYQVSIDGNKLMWEQATQALPWICVHDKDGQYSRVLLTYNVQKLPTAFLIDRSGTIVSRNLSWENLPTQIEKCLRKKP